MLAVLLTLVGTFALGFGSASAVTTVFFDASQTTNQVASGETWDRLSSEGYLFTYTRDKLFTGGVGLTNPVGRMVRVNWPQGLEAQAVTAGPNPGGAQITIQRVDGQRFDIHSLSARLLANTSGAGGSFEIMPMLNGEDALSDPFYYNANGNYGTTFTYRTPTLTNYEGYKIHLYVDFALVDLTVIDASLPPPQLDLFPIDATTLQLSWPASAVGYQLESTPALPAAAWSPVTEPVVLENDLYTVIVSTTEPARFFRLHQRK